MNHFPEPPFWVRARLQEGLVIPAHPLALDRDRRLDERRQRALTRYYHAAGAGGVAVGVHTTQFGIRHSNPPLLRPVLALAAEAIQACDQATGRDTVRIAGLCGDTRQAVSEASMGAGLGYHAGLISLAALPTAGMDELVAHCTEVATVIPLIGFYLQPAAGGRLLPLRFWQRFVEIENVVAIKIAPFNRYQTIEVLRAVAESGRADLALYTGNDDHIVSDLLTPFRPGPRPGMTELRFVGGLLGQWSVWTRKAVELHAACRRLVHAGSAVPMELLRLGNEITDANAALFDAANGFSGCISGLHEVLRRQGLLEGIWCLDRAERLGPGQAEEIDRVMRAYPHLQDDDFVAAHLEEWLR